MLHPLYLIKGKNDIITFFMFLFQDIAQKIF